MHPYRIAILCACLLLAACGGDKAAADGAQPGQETLPRPDAVNGSVTGMPNPGTPSAHPAAAAGMTGTSAADGIEVAAAVAPAEAAEPPAVAADGADAAIAVLRGYYAAINARDFGKAWSHWSDGGRASGQTLQQFADGFADTQGVSVALGVPGPIEGAAGSRFISIPTTLDATQSDGSFRHYIGSITLRQTVVDGATDAQRHWRLASADLREQQP